MYLSDWDDFLDDCAWLLKENSIVEVSRPRMARDGFFQPTATFQDVFRVLTSLLSLARVTEVRIDSRLYHVYGWTGVGGRSLGWQCLPPEPTGNHDDLHPDHSLLLACFGGIKERWHEPSTWLLNLNSALCAKDTCVGFNGWDEYFLELCEHEGVQPAVKPSDYRSFALEANGDCTMYHHVTGNVLMFAHDHSFDHIEQLPGCPEYTLYTIKGCVDFRMWVETLARQWMQCISEAG